MKKVGVIFGGRSGEHEVSLVSATSVIKALSPEKYEIIEIGITTEGSWYTGKDCLSNFKRLGSDGQVEDGSGEDGSGTDGSGEDGQVTDRPMPEGLEKVFLSTDPTKKGIVTEMGKFIPLDIVFPVLHGPFGEDGTIQGLFEMMDLPYVGCNTLASSTAMDKLQCKAIWEAAGLPVVPYVGLNRRAWENAHERAEIVERIKKEIGFPCFVKPANMGSSVGISKAKSEEELVTAIDLAAKFDRRILVEVGVNAREIECAILGNDDPICSPAGEVIVGGEFYDFNDKYVDGVSSTQVPAALPEEQANKIREVCVKAFKLLDCCGLSRVDSFIDRDTGEVFLNEINTMPGFTSISMYPKMMKAAGLGYTELVDKLLELGFERYEDKKKNQVKFDSGSDWFKKD